MKISKVCFVRICSFTIAILLVLSGFLLRTVKEKNFLSRQVQNGYIQSAQSLGELFSSISYSLEKMLYSGDAKMLTSLSNEIASDCASAKECVGRMPISNSTSSALNSYLSLTSDFARVYSTKENGDTKGLKKLFDYSKKVSLIFENAQGDFSGEIKLNLSALENNIEDDFLGSSESEEQISENLPTLIYDGPFSTHLENAKSKLLSNKSEISMQTARQTARDFCADDSLEYYTEELSSEKSFIFSSEQTVCAITKKGGYLLYFKKDLEESQTKISDKKACDIAKKYLREVYNLEFVEKYHMKSENVITINLCPKIDGVCVYADLIKVDVGCETGEILGVEARNFVLNHHERDYKNQFFLTKQEAKDKLNKSLKVKSSDKVLVTDSAQNEHFCYEFICSADAGEIAVYINAKTGNEQNVFIIEHAPGGTFAK